MFYFKFTTEDGEELYGKTNMPKEAIDLNKLKSMCKATVLEEVTEEEYERETEDDE